jgi:hypothetical protein
MVSADMSMTRTPISRDKRRHFTPEIIAAFKVMERARRRCTCPPNWDGDDCPACERWWAAHKILRRALRLPLWQWPAIETDENPYPAGGYQAEWWQRDRAANPERFELYAALKEAASDGH